MSRAAVRALLETATRLLHIVDRSDHEGAVWRLTRAQQRELVNLAHTVERATAVLDAARWKPLPK